MKTCVMVGFWHFNMLTEEHHSMSALSCPRQARLNCPDNDHYPNSRQGMEREIHGQRAPQAGKRSPNSTLRTREHLTEAEVERLMNAAKKNRWGHRDATMVLVAYGCGRPNW
jgi:hypothetical protein